MSGQNTKKGLSIFTVVFTNYEDDYKHRYDSGVYPSSPKLFRNKDNAERFLRSEIFDRINDHLNDHEYALTSEYISEDILPYIIDDNGSAQISESYKYDIDVLKSIYKNVMKGEFVDYMFDWSFKKIIIDD